MVLCDYGCGGPRDGLVRFSCGTGNIVKIADTLKDLLSHAATEHNTEDNGLDDEVRAQIDLQFNAPKLLKLQRLFSHDAAFAQSFLSSFMTPNAPLQMGLRDPTTGEELSLHEALYEFEHDLLHRSDKEEAGSPTLHAQVRQEVAQIRAAELKSTRLMRLQNLLPGPWSRSAACEHLQWKEAAVRLPRASCGFKRIKGFGLFWLW